MAWPPAELDTARLHLRKPVPGDADFLFTQLSGDAQITRYLGWLTHSRLEQARQQISLDLLRWQRGAGWSWLLEEAGQAIGWLQLKPLEPHLLRTGCMLAASHHGRGLMAEALHAMMNAAFRVPAIHRIEALCDIANPASARMLAKAGLRYEGRLASYLLHPNLSSQPRDAWLYARSRPEAGDNPAFHPDSAPT